MNILYAWLWHSLTHTNTYTHLLNTQPDVLKFRFEKRKICNSFRWKKKKINRKSHNFYITLCIIRFHSLIQTNTQTDRLKLIQCATSQTDIHKIKLILIYVFISNDNSSPVCFLFFIFFCLFLFFVKYLFALAGEYLYFIISYRTFSPASEMNTRFALNKICPFFYNCMFLVSLHFRNENQINE